MNTSLAQLDRAGYEEMAKKYALLGENIRLSLTALLQQKNIEVHQVDVRIKEFESFRNKLERKNYASVEEVEDICGIRIVCFYSGDLEKIDALINEEFTIVNATNKTREIPVEQFWYSSYHYVVTIKPEWLNIPDYRNLDGLKAEIQVRTMLEHAWAEIEHKLTYKVFEAIPDELKRPFAQLSAVLDLADERFNQLREDRRKYVESVSQSQFDFHLPVNADTLKAFLVKYFGDWNETSVGDLNLLVQQLKSTNITYKEIFDSFEKVKPYVNEIQTSAEMAGLGSLAGSLYTRSGVVRLVLYLARPEFYQMRKEKLPKETVDFLREWRTKISS